MRALPSLTLLIAVFSSACAAKPLLCYWEYWGKYRPGPYQGAIDKIPVDLCTHVIYSFVGMDNDTYTVMSLDPYKMEDDLSGLRALKDEHPALKVLVAIGGWNEGAEKYSHMASNESSVNTFVASVADFVEKYELDGCDLHWKFPGDNSRQASPEDKVNLIVLLQKLRSALNGKLLTIAVAGPRYRMNEGYDVPKVAENVDFINVLSFDLHGYWDNVTGNHVGLYGDESSVSEVMQNWHHAGAPKQKLLMGIAFYGKSFTLQNPEHHCPGEPASMGSDGKLSEEADTLYYFEICDRIKKRGWKRVFDNTTKSPYAFSGDHWVGYEDVEGIRYKTDLIDKAGYAGAVVWAIEQDDHLGECGEGKFPLMKALSQGLEGKSTGTDDDTDEKPQPSSTTAQSVPEPTPTPEPSAPECDPAEELIPHTSLCSKFIHCVFGRPVEMRCPDDLIFDNSRKVCNWPFAVGEKLPAGCPDPLG